MIERSWGEEADDREANFRAYHADLGLNTTATLSAHLRRGVLCYGTSALAARSGAPAPGKLAVYLRHLCAVHVMLIESGVHACANEADCILRNVLLEVGQQFCQLQRSEHSRTP